MAALPPGLRILMLAPEPMVRPRGTPLSVLARLRALSDLGGRVDLLTYPFGDPVGLAAVKEFRVRGWPLRREPPIGPSAGKVLLDLRLWTAAADLLRQGPRRPRPGAARYDLLWTHEEAVLIGAVLTRRFRVPHLYDMHSFLPDQMAAYGWFRPGGAAVRLARRFVRRLLRRCDSVVTVCPSLTATVRALAPDTPVTTIENPPITYLVGFGVQGSGFGKDPQARLAPSQSGVAAGEIRNPQSAICSPRVVYCGNLARNQGIGLLLGAMAEVRRAEPAAVLLVIGGPEDELARARRLARRLGVAGCVEFRGVRSPREALALVRSADCLVSPRIAGSGVPSKVYTYLSAGRPIVATDIPAHREVLDDASAVLVEPTPAALAGGILRALSVRRPAGAFPTAPGRSFDPASYLALVHAAAAQALR